MGSRTACRYTRNSNRKNKTLIKEKKDNYQNRLPGNLIYPGDTIYADNIQEFKSLKKILQKTTSFQKMFNTLKHYFQKRRQ